MLVEIPEPGEIAGMILAFLAGLIGLYAYYKLRPYVRLRKMGVDPAERARLQYYEEQLVEMKIRLDALAIGQNVSESTPVEPKEAAGRVIEAAAEPVAPPQAQKRPNMSNSDVTDYVLQLITNNPMTSRDIQVTLGKSREHTSRLMKKLYEDGLVERKSGARPFRYSLTEKGAARVGGEKNTIE